MNKPLQLIYDNVSYKMWLVNNLSVDCDIIFTIKTLLQYYGLKRTIKPPTINQIRNHDFNTDYIDDQGIAFTPCDKISKSLS